MKKSKIEIIEALKRILSSKGITRLQEITLFQKDVFSEEDINDETFDEIISDLAYDLDYYEPNEKARQNNISFYSDQRLEEIITKAIKELEYYFSI